MADSDAAILSRYLTPSVLRHLMTHPTPMRYQIALPTWTLVPRRQRRIRINPRRVTRSRPGHVQRLMGDDPAA